MPLLTQPFEAGMTGWIVVFGALIAELAAGAVTSQMSTAVTLPVLAFPVVVAFGFAVVQWWQVYSAGAEPASWWHLGGIVAAALTWLVWPTFPGVLADAGSARAACYVLPTAGTSACLHRAAQALGSHNLAWWLTGALILAAAPLTRKSRIAAWAAIPAAVAGCEIATHFLDQLLRFYGLSG
jgi:hypothetical protein